VCVPECSLSLITVFFEINEANREVAIMGANEQSLMHDFSKIYERCEGYIGNATHGHLYNGLYYKVYLTTRIALKNFRSLICLI